jgi:hypothetical protein
MPGKSGNINKSFIIWVIANILGFGALGLLLVVLPSVMSIRGFGAATLIISIPLSIAQWVALRRISQTSILWILTIPVGLLLAVLILRNVPDRLWQYIDAESTATLIAGYLLIGFMIGLPQWLILRRQFSSSSLWLLGSTAGVALGFGLVLTTGLIDQSGVIAILVGMLVYVIATGLIISWLHAYHAKPQTNLI